MVELVPKTFLHLRLYFIIIHKNTTVNTRITDMILTYIDLKMFDLNYLRFTEYQAELVRQKKEQFRSIAVFPCKLRVMKEHVYMSR